MQNIRNASKSFCGIYAWKAWIACVSSGHFALSLLFRTVKLHHKQFDTLLNEMLLRRNIPRHEISLSRIGHHQGCPGRYLTLPLLPDQGQGAAPPASLFHAGHLWTRHLMLCSPYAGLLAGYAAIVVCVGLAVCHVRPAAVADLKPSWGNIMTLSTSNVLFFTKNLSFSTQCSSLTIL